MAEDNDPIAALKARIVAQIDGADICTIDGRYRIVEAAAALDDLDRVRAFLAGSRRRSAQAVSAEEVQEHAASATIDALANEAKAAKQPKPSPADRVVLTADEVRGIVEALDPKAAGSTRVFRPLTGADLGRIFSLINGLRSFYGFDNSQLPLPVATAIDEAALILQLESKPLRERVLAERPFFYLPVPG